MGFCDLVQVLGWRRWFCTPVSEWPTIGGCIEEPTSIGGGLGWQWPRFAVASIRSRWKIGITRSPWIVTSGAVASVRSRWKIGITRTPRILTSEAVASILSRWKIGITRSPGIVTNNYLHSGLRVADGRRLYRGASFGWQWPRYDPDEKIGITRTPGIVTRLIIFCTQVSEWPTIGGCIEEPASVCGGLDTIPMKNRDHSDTWDCDYLVLWKKGPFIQTPFG